MKKEKTLLVVGLGCAGVAGLAMIASCVGLLFVGWRSASSADGEISAAVDDLMRAAADGSFVETYESATTPEFQNATSEADYAQLGEVIKTNLGALKSKQLVRVNLRQINVNTLADVEYRATFERGAGTIQANLKRSEQKWRFMGFRVNSPAMLKDMADQTCAKCGGKYAKSARFCPQCGAAVQRAEE
ncbi:MAG TPA: hypothetical protein VHC22_12330 [Pirellulales bacterium]|nr:hypothetical protein [Pirellulales bacterium]